MLSLIINKNLLFKLSLLFLMILFFSCKKTESPYFKIRVIDQETKLGVPMVGLVPLSQEKYYTDSNGFIAFREPGLMNKKVYFEVLSEGYEYPLSLEGKRSVNLFCKPGDSVVVKVRRKSVAERLYRSTGLGIYRDSKLLEEDIPIENPLINAEVLGQDSNLATLYRGKIFWVWGDTFLPPHYNGNFSVAAATSLLPQDGGLDPNMGVNYKYFVNNNGESKSMIKLKKPGYVWFDWIATLKDKEGNEKLYAKYANVNAYFQNYERGIAIFNDDKELFESYKNIPQWLDETHTCHHPFKGFENEKEFIYFTSVFDFKKVEAKIEKVVSPNDYYAFTCLKEGTKFDPDNVQLDRDSNGKLIYGWKRNSDPIGIRNQENLIASGKIDPHEAWLQLTDITTGDRVTEISRGSISWNSFRKKWIMISGAKDIWFSEADTPLGPWVYARKVAQHKSFFYNPTHHSFLDQNGGKDIFFEGTFTKFLSEEERVPGYDYNQLVYKLSLDNTQVYLPSAIYKVKDQYHFAENLNRDSIDIEEISFFAMPPDREIEGLIPVYQSKDKLLSLVGNKILFYAVPRDTEERNKFLGTWETQLDFPHFDNTFNITIKKENENFAATSNKKDFMITKFDLKADSINITITHPLGVYELEANTSGGNLDGTWSDGSINGKWEGTLTSKKWWGLFSDSLVDLYEFSNGNEVYYSSGLKPKKGFKKASKPLCKVWKNPSSQIITGFDIIPQKY